MSALDPKKRPNAPRLVGGRCQCTACGEFFTSDREFQRHRAGTYAPNGMYAHKRRCLSVEELIARGWRTDDRGFWMQGRPQRAPAALSEALTTSLPVDSLAAT